MRSPLKHLRAGLIALGAIFVAAVAGYCLAGWSLLDAVYMVVMTFSTVGYREAGPMTPALEAFTVLVIVVGVSTAFYIIGAFVRMTAEGEIKKAMGLRRVTREIEHLSGHVIICGFGRMGEILAGELRRAKVPLVIVDEDAEQVSQASAMGYLTIAGNAAEEETLIAAQVLKAKTVVTTLPSDAANVFITLTCRNLNRKVQIIARAEVPTTEKKLIQAGADHVVLPAATGAVRMAAMITRPTIVELIEVVSGRHVTEVEVNELTLPERSPLVGCTVRESQTRARHGLLIVAVRHADGRQEFNPAADTVFQAGDAVVVMGRADDITRFAAEYKI
jgi:voltage-gated potassium channel